LGQYNWPLQLEIKQINLIIFVSYIEKGEIEYADSERLPSITSASPGVSLNI